MLGADRHQFDPLTELVYLEQIGNVQDYFDSFKLLLSRVEISEELAIEVFLRGLEPEIQTLVRSFKPNYLYVAYSLARLKESTLSVLSVKEDAMIDELREETELQSAREESENVVVSEVFDEMHEKIIGLEDWTRSSYKSFDDEKEGIRVANSASEISDVFGESIKEEEVSWTKHDARSPRIEGTKDALKGKKEEDTQLARKRPTYPKIQKSNLRLGFANLEDNVLRRGEYCYELGRICNE